MDELKLFSIGARQKAITDELQRLKTNIGKDGPDRKTVEYKEKRLRSLEALWLEFATNHDQIKAFAKPDTPYVQGNTYEKVHRAYLEIKKILESINPHEVEGELPTRSAEAQTLPKGDASGKPQTMVPVSDQTMVPASDLAKLLRRHNATAQCLQRLLKGLKTTAEESWTPTFCSIKLSTLQKYWAELEEAHRHIHELSGDPTQAGYNAEEYYELEDEVQHFQISLTTRLEESKELNLSVKLPTPAPQQSLKLPKITLPKFDGNYTKWKEYSDLFVELVDKQEIANCQKLFYLKTTLTGEAESLIRHFTTSDSNYKAAWQVIRDRYDNPRLLVTAHVQRLVMQPVITLESAKAIKTLHDTTQECMLSLKGLNIDTTNWDPLLMYLLIKKLDRSTLTLWEQSLQQPKALPVVNEFLSFLEMRFQSLEAMGPSGMKMVLEDNSKRNRITLAATTETNKCQICGQANHAIHLCPKFLKLSPQERHKIAISNNRCINCLHFGHQAPSCRARHCTKCNSYHNTLLHVTAKNQHQKGSTTDSTSLCTSAVGTTPSIVKRKSTSVILGTAVVQIKTKTGKPIACRALLDSGSQVSLVTDKLAKSLGLRETYETLCVEGIGQNKTASHRRISFEIHSSINGFSTRVEAHVLPKIISPQPPRPIITSAWNIPNNIVLADSQFDRPGPIDLLIGAEIFYSTLVVGQISLGDDLPTLQNTVFGWTVVGKISTSMDNPMVASCGICTADEALDQQIERFWRLEEATSTTDNFTQAEKRCENHFTQTTTRDSRGRFVVRLPFKEAPTCLGESKEVAFRRFMAMERRLSNSPELKKLYREFMEEYQQLGHMQEVNLHHIAKPYYFLPHHCIQKPDSSTTKLRVVFDASAKTSTNLSLNDILSTGPTIQDDVFSMLLRFRMPRYVFTADIEKMYRQVLMNEEDQKFQLIWWRSSPNDTLKCFKLQTVTYGTTSASYLATKCLQTLARENKDRFPLGSRALLRDFYVDDVVTGSDKIAELLATQVELQTILQESGFKLRKWCANHASLMKGIPLEDREVELDFSSNIDEHIKTVGLTWMPKSDQLCVKTSWADKARVTKRSAYADIAHLFDPLGIMAPVVVIAKIFLQKLWELKLDWDAALPQEMQTTWLKYREGLQSLNNIKIGRHIFSHSNPKNVQYHIFADASEKAYGAAAYVRSVSSDNTITVRLLCSKSRVAPSKQTKLAQQATIPRLELCAACLATELLLRLQKDLKIQNEATFLWTDSEIVLAWINSTSSASLPIFVANRVSRIQQNTILQQWYHVPSKENPADVLSRGIAPERLKECNIWFYGPKFLHGSTSIWPPKYKPIQEKLSVVTAVRDSPPHQEGILATLTHKNSFKVTKRIIAFILRYVHNLKQKVILRKIKKNQEKLPAEEIELKLANIKLTIGPLSVVELSRAQKLIFKYMQQEHFTDEIRHLKNGGEVPNKNPYKSLTPFLDEEGLIRVGGRLEASALPYDAKHPILIPYSHPFTKLIFVEIHEDNKHVGPQTMLSLARQFIWAVRGKTIARSVLHNCVKCARAAPRLLVQQMGNLPADRIQPARPFINTGVDFCGPISTHYKIRGKHPQKSYIAIFCCFSTKACHLELVTDLTAQGFIGSLNRFMARRGHCRNIYCDNATNFVGAKNQLSNLMAFMESETEREKITSACVTKGCDFQFIPPRSPHFGGLWEAAVKSSKHLLQHTLAEASLTYEELETAVTQVEAILNSRPITPMSESPNDLTALTPGHFLIGEPLVNNADSTAAANDSGILTRWKLVSHLKNEFWRRWSRDYLNQLQHRYKWRERCQNVQPGMMVIIKEDNIPSLRWPLGRITNVVIGDDGLVRVADVRTSTGIFRRAIHRLAPLPVPTQDDSSDGSSNLPQSFRNSNDDPVPKKKIKLSPMNTLLVCLLLIGTAFGQNTKTNAIDIQNFETNPGLYFEDIGQAKLITDEWNLFIYFNMTSYWQEFQGIQKSINQLRARCEAQLILNPNNLCKPIIDHLELRLQESENLNKILKYRNGMAIRKRRSPFDFVGTVANKLFGVLDQEYAQYIEDNIQMARINEKHLLELNKNQTSIIESTTNILNKSLTSINEQFTTIKLHLTNIDDSIENLNKTMQRTEILNYITIFVTQIMDSFQRTQIAILESVSDTHQGRINALLLSPTQLLNQLERIRLTIPSSLTLPGYDEHNLPKLYELLRGKARVTSSAIVFLVKLPLLNTQVFQLYKLIPLPVQHNKSFIFIQPSTAFLAVTPFRDQHFSLSQTEYLGCIHISERNYLCKQRHPVFNANALENQCEVYMLNHKRELSSYCKLRSTDADRMWIQLHNPNHWVFAFHHEEIVSAVCGSDVLTAKLQGVGLMKLTANCVIKQPTMTINAHNIYISELSAPFLPTLNLSVFVDKFEIEPIQAKNQKKEEIIIRGEDDLTLLKEKIAYQKTQQTLPNKISHHDVHQYSIGYFSFFGVVILATLLLLLRRKMAIAQSLHAIEFELKDLNAGENVDI